MQENLFTKQSRLLSISVRLGLSLSLGILIVLMPIGLASGASSSFDPVDPTGPGDLATAFYEPSGLSGQEAILDSAREFDFQTGVALRCREHRLECPAEHGFESQGSGISAVRGQPVHGG